MKIDKEISTKFKRLSFLLAVMVILIHSESLRGVQHISTLARYFHGTLRLFIWSPVPIFFMISGYFFANSTFMQECMWGGWIAFFRNKLRRLLVPYLCFSIYGTVLTTPIILVLNHIKGLPWYGRTIFAGDSIYQWIDAMFGVSSTSPLNNGPLWYVHSLMAIFLFAPIWRFIGNKLTYLIFLVPIVICYVMHCDMYNASVPILNIRYLSAWFFVGMVLSRIPKNIQLTRKPLRLTALIGIFVLLIKADVHIVRSLQFWSPMIDFAFIWLVYDCVFKGDQISKMHEFIGLSFWIYCVHAPISNIIVPAGHYLLGESSVALCLTTSINVVVMVVFSIASGLYVKHKFPKLFAILTGDRG